MTIHAIATRGHHSACRTTAWGLRRAWYRCCATFLNIDNALTAALRALPRAVSIIPEEQDGW